MRVSLAFWAVFAGGPPPVRAPGRHPSPSFSQTRCWHGLLSRDTGRFMGRNPIRVAGVCSLGGVRLPVALSQARGDFGVTPSVCLTCSRHPPGPEMATCPPRPPHTCPGWPGPSPAWACRAPCPRADTVGPGQRPGGGSWQMAERLPTAHSPSALLKERPPFTLHGLPSPHPGWLRRVSLVCLRKPPEKGEIPAVSPGLSPMLTPRAAGQVGLEITPAHTPQRMQLDFSPPAQKWLHEWVTTPKHQSFPTPRPRKPWLSAAVLLIPCRSSCGGGGAR